MKADRELYSRLEDIICIRSAEAGLLMIMVSVLPVMCSVWRAICSAQRIS